MAITKAELVQINSKLAAENEALRKQVEDLRMESAMHRTQTHRVAPHMPQWQVDRAAAMAAARDMAMRANLVVKV